jgi:hypothetical protein
MLAVVFVLATVVVYLTKPAKLPRPRTGAEKGWDLIEDVPSADESPLIRKYPPGHPFRKGWQKD